MQKLGDFTATPRMLWIAGLAVGVGGVSSVVALGLLRLIGLFTVLAVVAPVLLWQWRAQRGPEMVVALWVGLMISVGLAAAVGAVLVRLRFGDLNFDAIPLSGDHRIAYVIQAPPVFYARKPLQVAATFMWPAGTAALVYAAFAAGSARDDLGGPPVAAGPAIVAPSAPVQPGAPEGAVS